MPEPNSQTSSRFSPRTAWNIITDAPLLGLALAREAGVILSWDDTGHLLILNLGGERLHESRAPARVLAGVISDDGSLVALLIAGARLLLLDGEFGPLADRPVANDATTLAVDPHGRYVAVASRSNTTQLYTRHGRPAGSFETMHPLVHLAFVPDRPRLLGASAYGVLYALELVATDERGDLDCLERWKVQIMSSVGRLTTTGDGGAILASCHTHGVQRFDARGRNEGAYHLGGTASHAVPDFAGRTIAVATTEGELALLNSSGNVRWKTGLSRGPIALEFDALGRFIIYGLPTGEIALVDLDGSRSQTDRSSSTSAPRPVSSGRGGGLRQPAWSVPVARSDEQAETAVIAVLDDPPRVAVLTNRNCLQVFTKTGEDLGELPQITGIGRILRVAPGWIAGATDRQIVLYDARRNQGQRLDLSLAELTHLVIKPDTFGLALVQERDRIGRATVSGRWIWKRELRVPVEELAVSSDALTAVSTEDGRVSIFDPAGQPSGTYAATPPEPLCLSEAPAGSPLDVCWITLARHAQVLRGHRRDGRVLWESPVPFEPWQMDRLDSAVVVEAADGRALAFDGAGQGTTPSRNVQDPGLYFVDTDGTPLRLVRQGENLSCMDLSGRIRWRAIATEPIGPIAAGRVGVAAFFGRSLVFFPEARATPDDSD